MAFLFEWTNQGRVRWKWLALWAAIFAAYAFAEFIAHQRSGAAEAILYETPFALVRTVVALALRYLVMAATSYGVSAFHEPEPVYSALDPWWLCSLVVLGLLGWRVIVALRLRRQEFAYWAWAVVSYAPISQIFPFLYPLADRYLYFILPGLIGGALLAARDGAGRLGRVELRTGLGWAGAVAGVAAAACFAVRSPERAAVWRSPARILADSAANYPDGVSANLLRAKRAVLTGDAGAVAAALRAAVERGYNRFDQLLTDPDFAPVRSHSEFRSVVNEVAAGWIERGREIEDPTQLELRLIGNAHYARGEYAEAAEVLSENGKQLKDWLKFDLEFAEIKLAEMFASVADTTRIELERLAQQARQVGEWHTGEITSIGILRCKGCGELLHFDKTGHIPPCPKCHGTVFTKKFSKESSD